MIRSLISPNLPVLYAGSCDTHPSHNLCVCVSMCSMSTSAHAHVCVNKHACVWACVHLCACVNKRACMCVSKFAWTIRWVSSVEGLQLWFTHVCVCVLCVVCVCECVHLYVFESTLTTLCHSFCLIKLMCIGLIFFMCTVNQHSSTPPLTQQLYALHMLRPKHLDILLFPVPFLLSGILCLLT